MQLAAVFNGGVSRAGSGGCLVGGSDDGAGGVTNRFAVTPYNPDAPTGRGFWRWAVALIGPDISNLAGGAGEQIRDWLARRSTPD